MQLARPAPVDLAGVTSHFHPGPFYIPHEASTHLAGVNDLTTRLGRAYERILAFEEKEYTETTSMLRNYASNCMDRIGERERVKQSQYNQYEYIYVECVWRGEAIREIKRALNYELGLAKEEAGQQKNNMKKPARTVAEWDAILGS